MKQFILEVQEGCTKCKNCPFDKTEYYTNIYITWLCFSIDITF